MQQGLDMDGRQRAFVGIALPLLFLGLTVVPWLLTAGDLPSPIASHFDGAGDANGSVPLGVHLAVVAFFTLGASAILLWAAWHRESRLGAEAAVATFVGWLLGFLNAIVLQANSGHDRWQDVTIGSGAIWGSVLSSFGAAIPVSLMVRSVARRAAAETAPAMELGGTERAAWFGRSSSVVVGGTAVLLALFGTAILITVGSGAFATGLVLLAAALLSVALLHVDVAVSGQGVRLQGGLLHLPRMRFALDEIEAARAVDWQPMRGGIVTGWGYRGSLRLLGRAGWVLRKGPALELDLTGGRRFVVTVDRAAEAAAVVNGLLARGGATPPG
jgi:hypothetical protein